MARSGAGGARLAMLRTLVLAMLLLAPLAAATHPVALPGEATATVSLVIDASAYPVEALAEDKSCTVTVPADAVAASVLDKATLDACIAGWTWGYFPGLGRFVLGIDGRQADPTFFLVNGHYWYYFVNGAEAQLGVDQQPVGDGDTLRFVYCTGYPCS